MRGTKRNPIADGDGVGASDALETEVSLNFTLYRLSIVREDGVPTACIFNDEAVHYTVMISLFLASMSSSSFLMYLS